MLWFERNKKYGRENTAKNNFHIFRKATVFILLQYSSTDNEQERKAPPPGSPAKLLTANGHFVRDSSPPRVTISSRVPALFSFASFLSFDRLRYISTNFFLKIFYRKLRFIYFLIPDIFTNL